MAAGPCTARTGVSTTSQVLGVTWVTNLATTLRHGQPGQEWDLSGRRPLPTETMTHRLTSVQGLPIIQTGTVIRLGESSRPHSERPGTEGPPQESKGDAFELAAEDGDDKTPRAALQSGCMDAAAHPPKNPIACIHDHSQGQGPTRQGHGERG